MLAVRNLRYLLLALVFWFSQTALLVHATDVHTHDVADTCTVCLHVTPMGGALPAARLALPPPQQTETPLSPLDGPITAASASDTLARGPPAFS